MSKRLLTSPLVFRDRLHTGAVLARALDRRVDLDAARALDRKLRGARLQPSFAGRTTLLVDDGLATGATMIAAARWAIERGAGWVIAAAPVAAREAVDLVRQEADEVVCPYTADDLGAVGLWYQDFPPVDDEHVAELLRAARETRPALAAR